MVQIVDLSQDIYQGMYVYPGHLKTVVFDHAEHEETLGRFESDFSYATKGIMINDNGPTHVDSFSHMDPSEDALTVDQMPLDLFFGPGICLDVSEIPPRTDITAEHLDAALQASEVEFRERDIVLLYTGTFNRYHGKPEYLTDFPGLGETGSQWMLERGVKTFGVDSPTPDNPASRTYPCHLMCRDNKMTHYENLANLDRVLNVRFTFVGLPLRIRGAHGGPTRAVALLEDRS